MNERTKRILTIALFILSVFVIGFIMYIVFFKPQSTQPPSITTPGEQPSGALTPSQTGAPGISTGTIPGVLPSTTGQGVTTPASPIANGNITQTTALTTAPVSNPILSTDGSSENFYNAADGKFYTINAQGKIVSLSDQTFPNVQTVTWNHTAQKAVLEFPDGSNIIYDFKNQKQITLPKQWEGFSFSPTTDEIAAKSIGLDENNRWLLISNDNGSNAVPFQALGNNADQVTVDWSPNNQVVAFADTASTVSTDAPSTDFNQRIIYPIGKNQENMKALVIEGSNFTPSWSPSGKTLLYSANADYSSGKPLLWNVDATANDMGQNRHSLGINTWADKCTWSTETTLYCAVPQNLPDNAGMQRDLYSALPDSLYKVDLASGQSSLVAIPDQQKTMTNLSVSKDASLLYFTDATSGVLNLIHLK